MNEHTRDYVKTRYNTGVIDHWDGQETVYVVNEYDAPGVFVTLQQWYASIDPTSGHYLYTRVTDHLKNR